MIKFERFSSKNDAKAFILGEMLYKAYLALLAKLSFRFKSSALKLTSSKSGLQNNTDFMNSNLLVSLIISKETLSSIDKDQLIDMLQHKTQLLLTARLTKFIDKEYTQLLRKEVENIQAEIRSRMG